MNPASASNGGARPAPPAFQLLELTPILRGNLLARVRLQMASGMIVHCNALRSRKDGSVFVLPVGERLQGGAFAPIIEFASQELRDAWQASALAAIQPRLAELLAGQKEEVGYGFDF